MPNGRGIFPLTSPITACPFCVRYRRQTQILFLITVLAAIMLPFMMFMLFMAFGTVKSSSDTAPSFGPATSTSLAL